MQLHNFIARAVVDAVVLVDDEKWYSTMMVVDSVHLVHPAPLEKLPILWTYGAERSHSRHYSMCFPMFGDSLFEELLAFASVRVLQNNFSPELMFFRPFVQHCVFFKGVLVLPGYVLASTT